MRAIHPGEHLAEELDDLGMSAAALARQIGALTNRVTAILNGRRTVTGDTALRLAHFFGTSPEFWPNLQKLYELHLAREKAGKSILTLPTLKTSATASMHQKGRRRARVMRPLCPKLLQRLRSDSPPGARNRVGIPV